MRLAPRQMTTIPFLLLTLGLSGSATGITRPPARPQAHPAAGTAPGVGGGGIDLLRRQREELPEWTGEEPLSLVAILDLSSSVSGASLAAATAGLRTLFSSLDANRDRCALLGFTRSVELHAGWDGTCADAAAATSELRAGGPAAFNNALTLALGLLANAPGRPVLVVFTDGADGASWARDTWPLFAAGAVPPTLLAVTAPPAVSASGRVGGGAGHISADDLWTRISGSSPQEPGRGLRALRNVDPFWILTYLADVSGGQLIRTSGDPGEIEAAFPALLEALQPE